ncbi:MAG: Flagellar FliJ protein [Cyanobacteria bacterium RYN_339]|nr:Flagellar FliJ protein [Cyanobacteria bacterium RYN_339]
MKRFTFRYQTLLEVRERAQQQEQELLQHLLRRQQESQGELAGLFNDEQAQRDAWLAAQQSGGLDLDDIAMIQQFLYVLDTRIRAQRQAVEDSVARVDNQRELLTEAMRQAEIIRKLKERDEKAWRAEVESAEAKELDELATLRHAYNQTRH